MGARVEVGAEAEVDLDLNRRIKRAEDPGLAPGRRRKTERSPETKTKRRIERKEKRVRKITEMLKRERGKNDDPQVARMKTDAKDPDRPKRKKKRMTKVKKETARKKTGKAATSEVGKKEKLVIKYDGLNLNISFVCGYCMFWVFCDEYDPFKNSIGNAV